MEKISVVNECETKTFHRKYVLPEVVCNFPIKRNKFHDIPQNEEWMQWIFEMSCIKYKDFSKIMGTGQYVHYLYPLCKDIHRYELIYKYLVLFFVIDDHTECDHGHIARHREQSTRIWTQFGEIFDKLEGNDSVKIWKWMPYIFAMFASLEPIYKSLNDFQRKRFNIEWRKYVLGNIEETEFIEQGRKHESVDQLNKIKINSGAGRVVIQMAEFADQLVVPEHVWEEPRMQKILDLAAIHMTNTNDIFSFEKEFKDSKDLNKMFNSVAVLCVIEDIPPEESMERMAKIVVGVEKEINELENQLINEPGCLQITKDFIELINICIGANYKCNTFIDRYNKV